MKKKLYLQSYFLINSNYMYEHSFGVRMKVIGLNGMIFFYGLARLYFGSLRAKAAPGEKFE